VTIGSEGTQAAAFSDEMLAFFNAKLRTDASTAAVDGK
jgi:hypothetical protein